MMMLSHARRRVADPGPYYFEKSDPDTHKFSSCVEAPNGAMEGLGRPQQRHGGSNRAVDGL
jgi:hypothetical protein